MSLCDQEHNCYGNSKNHAALKSTDIMVVSLYSQWSERTLALIPGNGRDFETVENLMFQIQVSGIVLIIMIGSHFICHVSI